jgi:hypothetical protein
MGETSASPRHISWNQGALWLSVALGARMASLCSGWIPQLNREGWVSFLLLWKSGLWILAGVERQDQGWNWKPVVELTHKTTLVSRSHSHPSGLLTLKRWDLGPSLVNSDFIKPPVVSLCTSHKVWVLHQSLCTPAHGPRFWTPFPFHFQP